MKCVYFMQGPHGVQGSPGPVGPAGGKVAIKIGGGWEEEVTQMITSIIIGNLEKKLSGGVSHLQGSKGDTGLPGPQGPTGLGVAGPPVGFKQFFVKSACDLMLHCAHTLCPIYFQGKDGAPGSSGQPGADGRPVSCLALLLTLCQRQWQSNEIFKKKLPIRLSACACSFKVSESNPWVNI